MAVSLFVREFIFFLNDWSDVICYRKDGGSRDIEDEDWGEDPEHNLTTKRAGTAEAHEYATEAVANGPLDDGSESC